MGEDEIEELIYFIRIMYLGRGYESVSVNEVEKAQYPPHRDSFDVWRIVPPVKMAYDESMPSTVPKLPSVDLRAEWCEKGTGRRFIKLWHGYCPEMQTVYFAVWPRYW